MEFLRKTMKDILTIFWSNKQVNDFDIWTRSEQFLYQNFAQKSSAACQKNGAIPIELGYVTWWSRMQGRQLVIFVHGLSSDYKPIKYLKNIYII